MVYFNVRDYSCYVIKWPDSGIGYRGLKVIIWNFKNTLIYIELEEIDKLFFLHSFYICLLWAIISTKKQTSAMGSWDIYTYIVMWMVAL